MNDTFGCDFTKEPILKKTLLSVLGIITIAATGCNSNGGTNSPQAVTPVTGAPTTGYPQPGPGDTVTPASRASGKFTIHVPPAVANAASIAHTAANVRVQSNSRKPSFISVHTGSILINMNSLNGSAFVGPVQTTTLALTNTAQCTSDANATPPAVSDTGFTCTVLFPTLPVGVDGFTLDTFASATGTGAVLSTNKVSASILVGQVTNIPITLAGVIASITLSLNQGTQPINWLTPGTPGAVNPLVVAEYDAALDAILGAEPFQTAGNAADQLNVTDSDAILAPQTTNATAVANAILTSPATTDSYSYTGQALTDSLDVITVTDAQTPTITLSLPIRVNATNETLTTVGTPVDALLNGTAGVVAATPAAPELAFPLESNPSNTYTVLAGNDSTIVSTVTELGSGTATSPFAIGENTCTGESSVLTVATGVTTLTMQGDGSTQGGATALVPVPCTITVIGGGSDVVTINLNLTGSANGGNFVVQGIHKKV